MPKEDYIVFDIETTGLSPLSSRITCICCKMSGDKSAPICFASDIESAVIESFCNFVRSSTASYAVTYNGWAFDVPFLRVRAMLCGVKLPAMFWNDSQIVDPFHILARNKTGKQSDFASLFGYSICGTGLDCIGWFEKGQFNKIKEHCSSDIVALDTIFCKMLDSGFVG